MNTPRAGEHYPSSLGQFQAWFRTDADCLDYLEWLRWPQGFVCPDCDHSGWRLGDGRFMCSACGARTSVKAGTIFDRTRTPLTVWFTACWLFATAKDGVSALGLKRVLEIGSYQTAWAMGQYAAQSNPAFIMTLGDNYYPQGVTGTDDPR